MRKGMLVLLLSLATICSAAQARHPISGRQIAGVMSVEGAPWLERPEREKEENTTAAIEALELKPGMVVADIGAGTGYYSFRMAKKVGPAGKIYANEIQQGMLDILSKNKPDNVVTVLGTIDDPKLPQACCDLILMVDVYHELSEPQKMLRKMRDELKPDGRLVLVEFRKEDPKVPIKLEH